MYKILKQSEYCLDDYSVVSLRKQDILKIMEARNAQMDYLRQKKQLTEEDQKKYYETKVKESFGQSEPDIILFSFLKNGECIGYGGLTNLNFDDKRAELSFLLFTEHLEDKQLYKKEFSTFIQLMKRICFEDLEFNRLFSETYDIRDYHIKTLEENGMLLEGRLRENIRIKDKFIDSLIHAILRKDYVKR